MADRNFQKESGLAEVIQEVHATDPVRGKQQGGIHPLSLLFVSICYILVVISFSKWNIAGLAAMVLYLLVQFIWHGISWKGMFRRIWPVLVLTAMTGIANSFFDREVIVSFGNIEITSGMLSMAALILKGVFCVIASYILVMQTGVVQLCYALRCLYLPEEMITVLLLMHRYLVVLLKEVERMQQAYRLRAPGQKGLDIKVWGSFVGLLLLRSMNRAEEVYESMKLRGFGRTVAYITEKTDIGLNILYVVGWCLAILVLRFFPLFQFVGFLVSRW